MRWFCRLWYRPYQTLVASDEFTVARTAMRAAKRFSIAGLMCLFAVSARAQSLSGWSRQDVGQGYQLLVAPKRSTSHQISLMIAPPEQRESALANWLVQRSADWAALLSAEIDALSPIERQSTSFVRTMKIRLQNGRHVAVYLVGYETNDQRRLLGVIYDAGLPTTDPDVAAAIRYASSMAASRVMETVSAAAAPAGDVSDGPALLGFGPPNAADRPPWLRAGRGVGDAAVHRVLPHIWCGVGYGGYGCTPYVYIFLKDRRVFDSVYASPRDFDPVAAQGQISEGRWRENGSDIQISWLTGSQAQEVIAGPIREGGPAPSNLRIDGRFSAGSAHKFMSLSYGIPTGYGSTAHIFTFRGDGTFDEAVTVGTYGSAGVNADRSVLQGRYRISGFTIEFAYSNGTRDNRVFSILAMQDAQVNAFILGDLAYGRER